MSAAASPATAAVAPKDSGIITGRAALTQFESGRPVPGYKNTDELLAKHKERTNGKPYFRFPPEPNGYLHIGHAKSMRINFGEAKANNGKCYLRFDDTNPETEEQEYIDSIIEMVGWMGWKPDWITYSSDYFNKLYELAVSLIKNDKAYVDHSTGEEVKMQRETLTESKWRNRPIAESLQLFEHMRQGRFAEGAATLRLKMDMKSANPNLRDIIAYRIKYCAHPHVGDAWCIYPSYDYTHCLIDSLEDIDYSICTLEFETRRESYFWLLAELNMYRPNVWEFSRLNVTGSLLSKRKIIALVNKGVVRGFDDARLLTLAGMRRRGYTPAAINRFCDLVGVSRAANVIDMKLLEHCLRETLDTTVQRRMGIVNPVRLVIDNWQGEKELEVPNHPADPSMGTRKMMFSHELVVDASDYRLEEDKNFFGLTIGKVVGLKYSGNVTVTSFERDSKTGAVTAIHADIDFDRAVKPKTNISWLSAPHALRCETRLYTPLLTDDKAAIVPDFMQYIDENSETVVTNSMVEKDVASMPIHTSVQFERFGYFCVDTDTVEGKRLVLNRVVSLREDKEKVAPAAKPAAKAAAPKPKPAPKPQA